MIPDVTLVYDDAVAVPSNIASLTGVDRFGSLLYRRQRLWQHASAAARAAGFAHRVHLEEHAHRVALAEELVDAPTHHRFAYVTSDVVSADPEVFARFLAKVAWSDHDLIAQPAGARQGSGIASLGAETLRRLLLSSRTDAARRAWWTDGRASLEVIPADPALLCLYDPDLFVRYLSGSFYTRAFNAIRQSGRTVVKRSSDREKMRREHDYWYLLPTRLQRFVVQPFDFQDEAGTASYRMERLNVPDMAILWIHGADAVSDDALEGLLDVVFDWFAERPTRAVSREEARRASEEVYLAKLDRRIASLMKLEVGERLHRLLCSSTPFTGVASLVDRYKALLLAEWARHVDGQLAVMHGDLCFSNILYDKRSGLVRFIDPRGARSEEELWGDPYYDLAKLSHSILGGYDFLNNGLFDVLVGEDLQLELKITGAPTGARAQGFLQRVRAAGFDPMRMRLYEASLFLSMLPLHAEDPRKLVAFVLTAAQILDEVEAAPASKRSLLQRVLG